MVNKVVFAVTGTGLTATAGAGTYFYLTSNWTIKGLFEKNKGTKSNLTSKSEKKNDWLDNWKKYIADNTQKEAPKNKNNPWNVGEWTTNQNKLQDVPEEFAKACEDKLNDKVKNAEDQNYKNFISWCVK